MSFSAPFLLTLAALAVAPSASAQSSASAAATSGATGTVSATQALTATQPVSVSINPNLPQTAPVGPQGFTVP